MLKCLTLYLNNSRGEMPRLTLLRAPMSIVGSFDYYLSRQICKYIQICTLIITNIVSFLKNILTQSSDLFKEF